MKRIREDDNGPLGSAAKNVQNGTMVDYGQPQSQQPPVPAQAPTDSTDPDAGKPWYEKSWNQKYMPMAQTMSAYNKGNIWGRDGAAQKFITGLQTPEKVATGLMAGGAIATGIKGTAAMAIRAAQALRARRLATMTGASGAKPMTPGAPTPGSNLPVPYKPPTSGTSGGGAPPPPGGPAKLQPVGPGTPGAPGSNYPPPAPVGPTGPSSAPGGSPTSPGGPAAASGPGVLSRWAQRGIGFGAASMLLPDLMRSGSRPTQGAGVRFLHPNISGVALPSLRNQNKSFLSAMQTSNPPGVMRQYQEETEEPSRGTKARRTLELVGRRTGDARKKMTLARASAIKTNVIDEESPEGRMKRLILNVVREKQSKKKKKDTLADGEAVSGEKTKVDTHPTLKREPVDQVRF